MCDNSRRTAGFQPFREKSAGRNERRERRVHWKTRQLRVSNRTDVLRLKKHGPDPRRMDDNFMRHFRWITPLLLAFSVFMLQEIYMDFKEFKKQVASDMQSVKIDVAMLKVFLTKKIDR